MITTIALFDRLESLRVAGGYTCAEIAAELGVHRAAYTRWRKGRKAQGKDSSSLTLAVPSARREPDLRRVINWLIKRC